MDKVTLAVVTQQLQGALAAARMEMDSHEVVKASRLSRCGKPRRALGLA